MRYRFIIGGIRSLRRSGRSPFFDVERSEIRLRRKFERVYPKRYEKTYGYWRPVIGDVVGKFLLCGELREGFARVRCEDCGTERFVAFSCHQRLFCPSCAQKRILELAIHTQEEVCYKVPHRQFVFTMPKRLRIYFRYDRELLKELPKLAWEVVKEI